MDRLLLSLLVAAFFGLCVYGMWRGWRRQGRAQSVEFPPFPEVPAQPGEPELEAYGLYVCTTRAGRWQERIVTRGAGLRTSATLRCYPGGIEVERVGAPGFWIPRESVVDIATGKGMAGKVMGTDSLLVITWRVGEENVDTGFRGDDVDVYPKWIDALGDGATGPQTKAGTENGELRGRGDPQDSADEVPLSRRQGAGQQDWSVAGRQSPGDSIAEPSSQTKGGAQR